MVGKILIDEELCKGCRLCIDACPLSLIRITNHINSKGYHQAKFVDPKGMCTGCTLCALICPEVAIEVYRQKRKRV